MGNCLKICSAPTIFAMEGLEDWRNKDAKTCLMNGIKKAVTLPTGIVLGVALLIEGIVRAVFVGVTFPLVFFDATKDFYLEQAHLAPKEMFYSLFSVLVSFTQLFTVRFAN